MKKKLILLIASCSVLIIIGIVGMMFFGKSTAKSGILHVNGKDITSEYVKIYKDHADLPLIEVLEALDFKLEWLDDRNANIIYNDKKYKLSLTEISLVEEGGNMNLLSPPPGSRAIRYEVLNRELILESNLVKSVTYLIKKDININIDHDKLIVYITDKND